MESSSFDAENPLSVRRVYKLIITRRKEGKPVDVIKEIELLKLQCKATNVETCALACQAFVSLVERGIIDSSAVLAIMIALLPKSSFEQYSALTDAIFSILLLDLKRDISKLKANQKYKCPYGMKTQQHPAISILEKDTTRSTYLIEKIVTICDHPDEKIKSECIEFLRPFLLYILCNTETLPRAESVWMSLLKLTVHNQKNSEFVNEILTWSKISSPATCLQTSIFLIKSLESLDPVKDYQLILDCILYLLVVCNSQLIFGLNPMRSLQCIHKTLTNIKEPNEQYYNVLLVLFSHTLHHVCPANFNELMDIIFTIMRKGVCSNKYIQNMILDGIIKWMTHPDFLSPSGLSLAHSIVKVITAEEKQEPATKSQSASKDLQLSASYYHPEIGMAYDIARLAEQFQETNHKNVFNFIDTLNTRGDLEFDKQFIALLRAIFLSKDISIDCWFKVYQLILSIVKSREDAASSFLMTFLYKLSTETCPEVQLELLRGLPYFAIRKESIPFILNTFDFLRNGMSTNICMDLYARLWKIEDRTYSFLHELLCAPHNNKCSELEFYVTKSMIIRDICITKPSQHGSDLVPILSNILNHCSTDEGDLATATALDAITALCESNTVSILSAWKVLSSKFRQENRIESLKSLFKFFAYIPAAQSPTLSYETIVEEVLDHIWHYITRSDSMELVAAAFDALKHFTPGKVMYLKHIPQQFHAISKQQAKELEARDGKQYLCWETVPGECWIELLQNVNDPSKVYAADLIAHYIAAEVAEYRTGIYDIPEHMPEPKKLLTLGKNSILRAVINFLIKQSRMEVDMMDEAMVTNALRAISKKFPKPIPPFDWCLLMPFFHMGFKTRKYCLLIAANQMEHSGTARRLLENFLNEFEPNCFEEDLLLLLGLLPGLSQRMPSQVLKAFAEKVAMYCFKESQLNGFSEGCLFEKFLDSVKYVFIRESQEPEALDIFTLIVERYMDSMELDSKIFEKYTEVVSALHPRSIDGLTSPATWWEIPVGKLKKATIIRCYLALNSRLLDNPLSWLDPIVDIFVDQKNEQVFFFQHLAATLYAFKADSHVYDWIMDLFRQIQILLADTTNNQQNNEKISFLLDVCIVSIVSFSGYIVILEKFTAIACSRELRVTVLPQSVNLLLERPFWKSNEAKIIDVFYTMYKNSSIPESYSEMFRNTITCLRNRPCFEGKNVWTNTSEVYKLTHSHHRTIQFTIPTGLQPRRVKSKSSGWSIMAFDEETFIEVLRRPDREHIAKQIAEACDASMPREKYLFSVKG